MNQISAESLHKGRADCFWREFAIGKCWQWLQLLLKVASEIDSKLITRCGGLLLAGYQVPTQPFFLSLLSRTGGEKKIKSSWVKIRTGRSLNCYCHRQNRFELWKIN